MDSIEEKVHGRLHNSLVAYSESRSALEKYKISYSRKEHEETNSDRSLFNIDNHDKNMS